MKFFKLLSVSSVTLMSVACSHDFHINKLEELFVPTTKGTPVRVVYDAPNRYENTKTNKHSNTSSKSINHVGTKRINTTQCTDLDDWYLDGYRVGRSFADQKAHMLQQRMNYCHISSLPHHFKNHWERGFTIGYREAGVPNHSSKGKKHKKT